MLHSNCFQNAFLPVLLMQRLPESTQKSVEITDIDTNSFNSSRQKTESSTLLRVIPSQYSQIFYSLTIIRLAVQLPAHLPTEHITNPPFGIMLDTAFLNSVKSLKPRLPIKHLMKNCAHTNRKSSDDTQSHTICRNEQPKFQRNLISVLEKNRIHPLR